MQNNTRLDFTQIKEDARGKWPGVFSYFGISVGDGRHGPCPLCGGKDRFRFTDERGDGGFYCNQCVPHSGDGFLLISKVLGIDIKEAFQEVVKIVGTIPTSKSQPEKRCSPELLRELFKSSRPIKAGDPATKYLKNRGLSDFPKTLRFTKKCWESDTKKNQDAILAVFSLPKGEAVTMHRIYIKDGKKLDIESPKKTLPPLKKMTGGAVRLYDIENGRLGIAEGIETAMAARELYGIPVWATLSTSLMEAFELPAGVKELVIFSDNDENYAGQKAAYTLANRVVIKDKIPVSVYVPKEGDFLDTLNAEV